MSSCFFTQHLTLIHKKYYNKFYLHSNLKLITHNIIDESVKIRFVFIDTLFNSKSNDYHLKQMDPFCIINYKHKKWWEIIRIYKDSSNTIIIQRPDFHFYLNSISFQSELNVIHEADPEPVTIDSLTFSKSYIVATPTTKNFMIFNDSAFTSKETYINLK